MKTCSSCHIERDSSEFYKNKTRRDGLGVHCRFCRLAQEKQRTKTLSGRPLASISVPSSKRCHRCGHVLQAAAFHRNRTNLDGLADACKACMVQIQSAHYLANHEAELAKRRAYYLTHRPQVEAATKRWQSEHPQKVREIKHAHYERNKPLFRLRQLKWAREHPERYALISRQSEGRRRARKRGGVVKAADYASIMERDGMRCYLCGRRVTKRTLHFDHVVPLAKGGAHSADNIRVTHATCNIKKGAELARLF